MDTIKKQIKDKHEILVRNLFKSSEELLDEFSIADIDLVHAAIGVSGEAGELVDALKKGAIYQNGYDRENIVEEIGDMLFYLRVIQDEFSITLDECREANIKKLLKRYPSGYKNEGAKLRADKS